MCQLISICNILLGVYTFGDYNKCFGKFDIYYSYGYKS